MPKYFKSSNASRPYRAGGSIFTLEPVLQVGGNWQGVLAVDDSAASILAGERYPQITEITQAEYEDAKKKPLAPSSSFFELRQSRKVEPVRPESILVQSAPASDDNPPPPARAAEIKLPEIKTARVDPQDELAAIVQAPKLKK